MKTREEKIKDWAELIGDYQDAVKVVNSEKAIRKQCVIDSVLNSDESVDEESKHKNISLPKFRVKLNNATGEYPTNQSLYVDLIVNQIYSTRCTPYAKYINNGMFVSSPITTTLDGITADVPNYVITPKGQKHIGRLLVEYNVVGMGMITEIDAEEIEQIMNKLYSI